MPWLLYSFTMSQFGASLYSDQPLEERIPGLEKKVIFCASDSKSIAHIIMLILFFHWSFCSTIYVLIAVSSYEKVILQCICRVYKTTRCTCRKGMFNCLMKTTVYINACTCNTVLDIYSMRLVITNDNSCMHTYLYTYMLAYMYTHTYTCTYL